jgi:hypothetical protein
MATTTPNFGWSVPTSTDLVKDGATAIETLGDSIDASMVDLKGGASGQVLSKNSATDMDFTWIDVVASTSYTAKTDNYTFVLADASDLFSMNASVTKQFSIPTDASVNFPIGTEITVFWITGAGQPTIGAVTPGTTTVISTGATSNTPKLRVANSGATCVKLAANSWIVFGDVV